MLRAAAAGGRIFFLSSLVDISQRQLHIAHMLDLQDYGVTKKWVIITEISKEVENNAMVRLNAYAKQYVPRRTGTAGGSSAGGGSSGRS
jgi:hypothetical protein